MIPVQELRIAPGLYTEATDRGAKGRWKDGNRVRFREGLPEKIGGWVKAEGGQFLGKCRGLLDWVTLAGAKLLGVGTTEKLYIWQGGAFFDITPYRAATDEYGGAESELSDPFTTVESGSPEVKVTHTAHGATVNSRVHFTCSSATFDGVTIDGEYTITEVIDADNYKIEASTNATDGSKTGGGTVDFAYEINVGGELSAPGLGWGAGAWGEGTWGTARSGSTFILHARTWALDKWGEDLLANPNGGGLYVWDASVGTGTRASLIANAPTTMEFMLVSALDRHAIAFGAHDGSNHDPLLIRWCDQEDYTDWTPGDTDTAGDFRLDSGTRIVTAVRTGAQILVLTDQAAYRMWYAGPPYIFSVLPIGDKAGAVGPLAAVDYGGVVYWMGESDFWLYDGGLRIIPCDVRNHVFEDINNSQRGLVVCGVNSLFQEITWYYPSEDSSENDRYVTLCVRDGTWSFGEMERTAWRDKGPVFSRPVAAGPDGYLYVHETGVDADGEALDAYVESYDMDIDDGSVLMLVRRLVPDFKRLAGAVKVTLTGKKYPHSGTSITKGPYTVTSATKFIGLKLRARQVSLKIACDGVGDDFRMGAWRAGAIPHGRR